MNRVIVVVFFQLFSNLHHHYLAVIGKLPVQEWDLPASSPFLDRKAGRKVVEIRSFFLSVTFYDWSDSRGSGRWLLFWGKYFQNCLLLTFSNDHDMSEFTPCQASSKSVRLVRARDLTDSSSDLFPDVAYWSNHYNSTRYPGQIFISYQWGLAKVLNDHYHFLTFHFVDQR